jgi:glycosyltransferase involved in cell wall biosynthesis
MKIALVLGTSAGGVGRHVHSVASGVVRRGDHVVVIGPAGTEELFGFTAAGARFEPVEISDRPHPVRDPRTVARLRRLLRGADVVHAHGLRAGALAVLALGPLRSTRRGPSLVVTLHNAVIAKGAVRAVYGVLERVVASGAASVLGVSPDLEERMRALGARQVGPALVPAPPPAAQAGPADRARVRDELGCSERPLLLTVARLADQKGLLTLLDAAAAWTGRTPRPLVVIAGDGPLEGALRGRIEAENLPVRLLGRRDDVPALLAAADVVVVPSVWEGQPLVVQEALRAGRPLVATEVGGMPDLVGGAALLVPAGDAEALRRAVEQILDDAATAVRLGAAAAQRATELPSEDDAVDQLVGMYQALGPLGAVPKARP